MSTITRMSIKELELDLNNFRTVPQASEREAIEAFISIHPDWFFGILESLIDYGYLPTESIIVLQESGRCVVKEGNRRIASMKLIHGFLDPKNFSIPDNLLNKISLLPADWLQNNSEVPCTVYT